MVKKVDMFIQQAASLIYYRNRRTFNGLTSNYFQLPVWGGNGCEFYITMIWE